MKNETNRRSMRKWSCNFSDSSKSKVNRLLKENNVPKLLAVLYVNHISEQQDLSVSHLLQQEFRSILQLKMADMYQYRIEKLSGIPGVTYDKMGFTSIFMFPIDCLLKKIPALNKRFDAAVLKDKIGIFADSMY